MKFSTIISCAFVLFLSFLSCTKDGDKMLVLKDCTGTYLQYEGKDYLVCNYEELEQYDDGTEVYARFRSIKLCNSPFVSTCQLYHYNEGWVELLSVE